MSNFDYYETLSVSPEASAEEIKKAYRRLALETHPDRNPGDARAEERFKKINEAKNDIRQKMVERYHVEF